METQKCLHLFDAYKIVTQKGKHILIQPGVNQEKVKGTHYGHCVFCGEWVDLSNVTIGEKR